MVLLPQLLPSATKVFSMRQSKKDADESCYIWRRFISGWLPVTKHSRGGWPIANRRHSSASLPLFSDLQLWVVKKESVPDAFYTHTYNRIIDTQKRISAFQSGVAKGLDASPFKQPG